MKLVMTGRKRPEDKRIKYTVLQTPVKQYTAAEFAAAHPRQYIELLRAGMPSGASALITVKEY